MTNRGKFGFMVCKGLPTDDLLDRAAADEMLILGFHFPFPDLGYAMRYGNAGWTVFA